MILLWLPSNWAFFSVIVLVNGCLFQFFASDADFYLRALRTTFWPVLVKLPCFQHYLSESNHFLGFVSKLHFWRFILPETCFGLVAAQPCVLKYFGLFAVKLCVLCVLQWYCTGKRFSLSLQRVCLIFPWFYSKRRFYLCLAKLRCSKILLLRTTFSFSFVGKLHIWRSMLPEKYFGLLATRLGCSEPYVTENSVFSLLCLKYAAFSFIAGKTCFGVFCRNSGLFPALLQRKRVCSESRWFLLDFTQRNVFVSFRLGYIVSNNVSENRLFFLSFQNSAFDLFFFCN